MYKKYTSKNYKNQELSISNRMRNYSINTKNNLIN